METKDLLWRPLRGKSLKGEKKKMGMHPKGQIYKTYIALNNNWCILLVQTENCTFPLNTSEHCGLCTFVFIKMQSCGSASLLHKTEGRINANSYICNVIYQTRKQFKWLWLSLFNKFERQVLFWWLMLFRGEGCIGEMKALTKNMFAMC